MQVSVFDRRDAQKRRSPSPLRVIPLASNVDWREDRRRRMGVRTNLQDLGPLVSMRRDGQTSSSSSGIAVADVDKIDSEGQKRGLQIRSKPEQPIAQSADEPPSPAPVQVIEQNDDQEAIQALLAGHTACPDDDSNAHHLVIPQQMDETQLLQNDIDTRPDAPTLDDYAAVPIEQFGMAMLRGMGWSETKANKAPQRAVEPQKRASLLGLGAKERQPASSRPTPHPHKRDVRYTPVTKVESRQREHRLPDDDDARRHHHRKHARRDRSASPPTHRRHRR